MSILPVLFVSESSLTLSAKTDFPPPVSGNPLFKAEFEFFSECTEYYYGHLLKEYLRARRVKQLFCVERDNFEATLYWTDYAKFNPAWDDDEPMPDDPAKQRKEVRGERYARYTHSPSQLIQEHKNRIAGKRMADGHGELEYSLTPFSENIETDDTRRNGQVEQSP